MNPNLFIWTSDWHVASTDTEQGFATYPTDAANVTAYIASLEPAGVIDTGDCKDDYGLSSGDEHDNYITKVRDSMPWATVNPGSNALYPILPGNHDELNDYAVPGASDFSMFDAKFWAPPYHWACDWAAPKIRFIGIHSYIHHSTDGYAGFFHVDDSERAWLQAELAALPAEWQSIVCSHAPANPAFGNMIGGWGGFGGGPLRADLAANNTRIVAYLNGHRHANMEQSVLDDIKHFNGPGMAYTVGNGNGGFVPIQYDPAAHTLTFGFLKGPPSAYPAMVGYTPVVLQLPALPSPPAFTTYTFASTAALAGNGPLAGSPVSLTGSIEVAA